MFVDSDDVQYVHQQSGGHYHHRSQEVFRWSSSGSRDGGSSLCVSQGSGGRGGAINRTGIRRLADIQRTTGGCGRGSSTGYVSSESCQGSGSGGCDLYLFEGYHAHKCQDAGEGTDQLDCNIVIE